MPKKNKYTMKPNTTFQELAELQREQLAKQKPVKFEEAKAQCERIKKQGEISFAKDAPKIQEYVSEMTTPLDFHDRVDIMKWISRKQITLDMLPIDVLNEFKDSPQYKHVMSRLKYIDKG